MPKISSLDTGKRSLSPNKVAEVKDFLKSNYEIRVNRFDPNPNRAIIQPKTKKFDDIITFDDISLHLLEEGIQCSDTLLRKMLKSSNYMTTFNPVTEYFEGLKGKWKGVSHIDLLAAHIRTRDYHDRSRDYYQERWYRYFKKWIVATAACAIGKRPNDVSLGLVHQEEGIGKTFFFEFITPRSLKSYFCKPKDDVKKFDMETAFAQNFLICLDELIGINRRSNEVFKKVMSEHTVFVQLPRDPFPKEMERIASSCFTTNKTPEMGGFLLSGMGYRRWLIIEIENINQEYSKKIDVDQLWAESIALLDQDFEYAWNLTDWEEFKQINERYKIETPSAKYLKMYFSKPINGEGEWMQPQEILQYLMSNKLIRSDDKGNINNENIGRSLTQLGYNKKKVRKGTESVWAYQVEKI